MKFSSSFAAGNVASKAARKIGEFGPKRSPSKHLTTDKKTLGPRKKLFESESSLVSLERHQRLYKTKVTQRPRQRIRPQSSRTKTLHYSRFNFDDYLKSGKRFLGPYLHELCKMRFNQIRSKRPAYSFFQKWMCVNVLLSSSAAGYASLRKIFPYASLSTIMKFLKKYKANPGISDFTTKALQVKVNATEPNDKLCFLLLDEMSLRSGLAYDESKDLIQGFTDDGVQRSGNLVKSALCVMVVGIIKKWKYPLGYFLTESVMKSTSVAEVIKQSFEACESAGFIVKGITSDQGSNLQKAFSLLGYTEENPTIRIGDASCVVIKDPPHLLKSARNFLLNGNVTVPGYTSQACWKHLQDVYSQDSLRSLKCLPKISKQHLYDLKFSNKMKVKLASQVISKSFAAALNYAISKNQISSAAAATSSYCSKFNDLFDVFNSSNSKDKVPLRRPISIGSSGASFLQESHSWLSQLQKLNLSRRNVFLKGWRANITALFILLEDLKKYQIKYLSIRNLCQDPLELFFGKVRQLKRYPDAKDFSNCYAKIATSSLIRAPLRGNCEVIPEEQLLRTESFVDNVSNLCIYIDSYILLRL